MALVLMFFKSISYPWFGLINKRIANEIIARQEQTAKLIEQRQAVMEGLFDQLAAAKDSSSRNAALDKILSKIFLYESKLLYIMRHYHFKL